MAEEYGFDEILQSMLKRVPDTLDKREGSIIYDALAPTAYMLSVQNYMLAGLSDMLFGDTAQGEWLDRIVKDYGIERKSATCAVRQIICYDSGKEVMAVPVGSRFMMNGICFSVSGIMQDKSCLAVCEQAGSVGNSGSGAVVPADNILGLFSAILTAEPVEAARDTESDDELRDRFYQHIRETPFGGNRADYREKALSIDGVGDCEVFAASDGMGAGRVGLVIADERGGCASEQLIARVKELFGNDGDGLAPVGHDVSVKTAEELRIDVEAELTLKAGSSIELAAPLVSDAAEKYINGLAFDAPTVFYSKLAAEILNSHDAILDAKLTMNGGTVNIALDKSYESYQIPVFGEITVSGAVK